MIDLAAVERAVNRAAVRYDRSGDQHYDVTSAFIKSIRGSDVDAAVHYLARMLEAGEDPRFIARRLMIHASEDIGMADPTALPVAVAAAQVVQLVGLPEARIALAQATIHLATAPKSNAVIMAIDAAMADVREGKAGSVPPPLRDGHYPGAAKLATRRPTSTRTTGRERWCASSIRRTNWSAGTTTARPDYGAERALAERVPKLRRTIRGEGPDAVRPDDSDVSRAREGARCSERRQDAAQFRCERTGGPEVLEYAEIDAPEPGPGEVAIQVGAAGVNFIDIYHRQGVYPMPLPFVPGREGAGRVIALGPDVTASRSVTGWPGCRSRGPTPR